MSTPPEALTIHLPASALRRLRRMAEIARRPVDEIAAETLSAVLPPLLEDVPARFQADLARMEKMPSDALRRQTRTVLSEENVARYQALISTRAERPLNKAEQVEWEALQLEADSLMFRKAYAALLLKWRGEHIPAVADLGASD